MAMVALAMLFLLKERVEHEESAPMLSARHRGTAGLLPSQKAAERRGGDFRSGQEAPTTPGGARPRPAPAKKAIEIVTK
jgi:hypothetical protein